MRWRAAIERLLAPGYSECRRCRRPWKFVEPRTVLYTDSRGCFALCTRCWDESTPPQRVRYYRQLPIEWARSGRYANADAMQDEIAAIVRSVRAESGL